MNFSANPHINDLEKLNKKINWNNIDCIIGIGGGSVIDMSKLLFISVMLLKLISKIMK